MINLYKGALGRLRGLRPLGTIWREAVNEPLQFFIYFDGLEPR